MCLFLMSEAGDKTQFPESILWIPQLRGLLEWWSWWNLLASHLKDSLCDNKEIVRLCKLRNLCISFAWTSITMNVLFPVRFFFWESEFTDANLGYSSNELGYKDGISGLSVCESKNIKGLPESLLPLFFLRLESVWPFSRKAQHDPVTNLWRQEPRAHSVLILYHLQWGLRPLRVPSPLLSTWCHCS